MGTGMGTRLYPLLGVGMGMRQKFDTRWVWVWGWDEFFLRRWVWDSETRPHPTPLSSLFERSLFRRLIHMF